ncbi:MAG TPA: glycosyltransferase family 39 protein [Chroococcidiopsis sp.]
MPLGFIAFILLFVPFGKVFVYNFDEGFELMRAVMQNHGFSLYRDIWSDQPPLFSVILRHWLLVFGQSIFFARLLILLMAALFLYFYYKTLLLFFDHPSAIFGAFILALTRDFIPFSVLVKVDMPAITLSVIASYFFVSCFFLSARPGLFSAALSGVLIVMALQTKLYTVIVIPVFLLYAVWFLCLHWKESGAIQSIAQKAGAWIAGAVVAAVISVLLYHDLWGDRQTVFMQLLESHSTAENLFQNIDFSHLVDDAFQVDYSVWILAGFGLIFLFSKDRWRIYFPCIWLLVVSTFFAKHTPVWSQYYLWLAIPLAWLCSMVFFGVRRSLPATNSGLLQIFRRWQKPSSVAFRVGVVGLVFVLAVQILPTFKTYMLGQHHIQQYETDKDKYAVLDAIKEYRAQTTWLVTDNPILAFYADLQIPPELVVISRKRVVSENFDGADLLAIIQKYHPEQVVLVRFIADRFDKPFLDNVELSRYLQVHYRDLTQQNPVRPWKVYHFVSQSIES